MTPEQGRILEDRARGAIAEDLGGPPLARPQRAPWLEVPTALFVSLHQRGELRGCIGTLEAQGALVDEVVDKAKAAAFHDARFHPLEAWELPTLEIELTLLGPLEAVPARSEEELIHQLRPGVDGLSLRSREGGAVFIPAVWRQLPDPKAFLQALMKKAQFHHWPADLQAFRFTADEVSSAAPRS